jgi:hypothetical protein
VEDGRVRACVLLSCASAGLTTGSAEDFVDNGQMFTLLLIFGVLPHDIPTDRVDVIERNLVVNKDSGTDILEQYIWWDYETRLSKSGVTSAYFVRDWRSTKYVPEPVKHGDIWVQEWWDERSRTHRRIESKVLIDTYRFWDVEIANRNELPESHRRKLKGQKE